MLLSCKMIDLKNQMLIQFILLRTLGHLEFNEAYLIYVYLKTSNCKVSVSNPQYRYQFAEICEYI